MNTHLNFLLFLHRELGLKIKLELSKKAKQDAVEYCPKNKVFIIFSTLKNIFFHFDHFNYPVIIIANHKKTIISEKIKRMFCNKDVITAYFYVFKDTNKTSKIFQLLEKQRKEKILRKEISLFEKILVYIFDRKAKLRQ
jgi:hypothetical protein